MTTNKNENDILTTLKKKVENLSEAAVDTASRGAQWAINNPEKVVAGIGLGIGVLQASRSLVVSHRVKMERKRIDHTYYDPSTGFHWDLRRAATNKDRAEILARKKAGEDIVQILLDKKLIKL